MFSGYHKLPQEDMYWSQSPDAGVPLVFNSMSRKIFRSIKKYLHLNDNTKVTKDDKMYKLRPYFVELSKNFLKFGVVHSKLSIDEMMVRYYGRHSAKMFMRGKPIKFGYKLWCMCSSSGYLYSFQPYCGKEKDNSTEDLLGTRVIKTLTSAIPSSEYEDHELFFDNFFSSHKLMCILKDMKLKATGTVRETRIGKCPLATSKQIQKEYERGYFDYRFDKSNEILVIKWNDNRAVSVITNYSNIEPLGTYTFYVLSTFYFLTLL